MRVFHTKIWYDEQGGLLEDRSHKMNSHTNLEAILRNPSQMVSHEDNIPLKIFAANILTIRPNPEQEEKDKASWLDSFCIEDIFFGLKLVLDHFYIITFPHNSISLAVHVHCLSFTNFLV